MPKVIVQIDGVVIKEMQLTKDVTTFGRRPYNDITIDNLAVSGEHAQFKLTGNQVVVEDRGSTNGTYVNGQAVTSSLLRDGDVIEIGRYQIRYIDETNPAGPPSEFSLAHSRPAQLDGPRGSITVLTGSSKGRRMELTKAVSTFGKPGIAVGSITRSRRGFELMHVEGETRCTVNELPVDDHGVLLTDGDTIGLATVKLQFKLD